MAFVKRSMVSHQLINNSQLVPSARVARTNHLFCEYTNSGLQLLHN